MTSKALCIAVLAGLLFGCGGGMQRDGAPAGYPDLSHTPDAVPRAEPYRKANMRTYRVLGRTYHPMRSADGFVQRGIASWYGKKFHGNPTATGERYDMYAMTAAHPRLPLPVYVRVTNLDNGRSAVVRVNDRGPFHDNRIIDLSYAAASKIGMLGKGTAPVEIRVLDPRKPASIRQATRSVPPNRPDIYIQAGAFGNEGNARRLANRLAGELQRNIQIKTADSPHGRIHRVQVGPLASVEVADRISATLRRLAIDNPQLVLR